jgi:hypothetical protein
LAKLVFLTFNDKPGGIFTSQVIDVCTFLRDELKNDVELISFISLRGFFSNRKKIRQQFRGSIVLPMWPGIENWRKNAGVLRRRLKSISPQTVIARGPFAMILAKSVTDAHVCFDARAAYTAEFEEYKVGGDKITAKDMKEIEAQAIRDCDQAIAVSHALVQYWRDTFNYSGDKHEVIPCTLRNSESAEPDQEPYDKIRIVFAGGAGKWQSIELISPMLEKLFERDSRLELLMLVQSPPEPFKLAEKFPSRVICKWVDESQVHNEMTRCDYGWMYRNNSITNCVASPVKFAEYLSAGLNVIISENLGDFSEFVSMHECGIILKKESLQSLSPVSADEKQRNRLLAQKYFRKQMYRDEYIRCIS